MYSNSFPQGFNANYRIGFYNIEEDLTLKIKNNLGIEIFKYFEVEKAFNGLLTEKPDVVLVMDDMEISENILEIAEDCEAKIATISRKPYNELNSEKQIISLSDESLSGGVFEIASIAMIQNVNKIKKMALSLANLSEEDIASSYMELLKRKDKKAFEHSQNVSDYALLIGTLMGLSEKELIQLTLSGKLHDIGKLCIPDTILFNKFPYLYGYKKAIMNLNLSFGLRLLSKSLGEDDENVSKIIYYARNLDTDVSLENQKKFLMAQIILVADIYDEAVVKHGRTQEEALTTLLNMTVNNKQLSISVISALEFILMEKSSKSKIKTKE